MRRDLCLDIETYKPVELSSPALYLGEYFVKNLPIILYLLSISGCV